MGTSLISGLTGLRSFQRMIDVIGNNLANSGTAGFKSSRVLFGDLVSRMLQPGSAPSGNLGGTNPMQIGQGVAVASIDMNLNQGPLIATGRTFDLALQGEGYFAMVDGSNKNYYSRVGSFDLDSEGNLVDLRSGMSVLDHSGSRVQIDLDRIDPPSATEAVEFARNLPAKIGGPLAEVLSSTAPFSAGTRARIDGGNGNPPGSGAYTFAGTEEMRINVDGGSSQLVRFDTAGSMTLAQIAAKLDTEVTGLSASVVGGSLVLESESKGKDASLRITDGNGQPAAMMGLSTSEVHGSESIATQSTDLNELTDNTEAYADGEAILISGVDGAGSPVSGTFTYGAGGDGTTLGDLRDFIDGIFNGVTATIDATGNLVLTADEKGEANLSLLLADGASNTTGSTQWSRHAFGVVTDGKGPDEVVTSIEVFDSQGLGHTVTFRFVRQSANEWDLKAEIPKEEGTLEGPATVSGITFGTDGTLQGISGNPQFTFTWAASGDPQTIGIDLGSPGSFSALTQTGEESTAYASSQDGYGVGSLESLSVDTDGTIQGFYSNRQVRTLGDIGVALFQNPAGLNANGDTLFNVSAASGNASLLAGGSGGAGTISAGSLESSNVDMAEEFIHLMEAQRGFQANARVITASDDLLQEVVNLV